MTHHQQPEHHENAGSAPCRICLVHRAPEDHEHIHGFCRGCVYKILIVMLIIMISISYIAWFGVL